MPISRIPGVGPTNADIAATISTTAAVSSQITASVPSASAIATAVAAPSIGTITSAITTNAASAGVTLAAITSAGNSAGWGATGSAFAGTYTSLYTTAIAANAQTVVISGLSGYKYLKIKICCFTSASNFDMFLRMNGDSANHSSENIRLITGTAPINNLTNDGNSASFIRITDSIICGAGSLSQGTFVIPDNNATTPFKNITGNMTFFDSSNARQCRVECDGTYWSTSAISSITLLCVNGVLSNGSSRIYVWGAN